MKLHMFLHTWIAKREDDPKLPGEAGVESICQRALALAGVAAAPRRGRSHGCSPANSAC